MSTRFSPPDVYVFEFKSLMGQKDSKKSLTFPYEAEKIAQSLPGEKFLLTRIVLQDGGGISHLEAWSHG